VNLRYEIGRFGLIVRIVGCMLPYPLLPTPSSLHILYLRPETQKMAAIPVEGQAVEKAVHSHPKPQHHKHSTQHPAPYTLHPTPDTLNPKLCTVLPTPHSPCTSDPKLEACTRDLKLMNKPVAAIAGSYFRFIDLCITQFLACE